MKSVHSALVWLVFLPCLVQAEETPLAFERTEEDRPRCAHYSATRQPFFGQLHLHTQYSADAATLQTRLTPRDTYRFAQGEEVGLAPFFDTRNALKDGLRYQQQHPEDGVNPFQLGFVGSLDNHNGTPSSAAATTCPRRCSSAPGRRRSGTCHEDGTAAP
ncbi:MAG TPA: DUF3604 domain-containing protein [Thermoanaerobaculia bacterium]